MSYSTYAANGSYCSMSLPAATVDFSLYPQYVHTFPPAYGMPSATSPPIKQEFYGDDEINPFSVSYASINEMPSYQEIPPYVSTSRHQPATNQRSRSFPTYRG